MSDSRPPPKRIIKELELLNAEPGIEAKRWDDGNGVSVNQPNSRPGCSSVYHASLLDSHYSRHCCHEPTAPCTPAGCPPTVTAATAAATASAAPPGGGRGRGPISGWYCRISSYTSSRSGSSPCAHAHSELAAATQHGWAEQGCARAPGYRVRTRTRTASCRTARPRRRAATRGTGARARP